MTARLTSEQLAELERSGGPPLLVEDPENHREYVLVSSDVYEQAKPFFDAVTASAWKPSGQSVPTVPVPLDWNDWKNERRCALIDKKYDAGLTPEEAIELGGLQAELAKYQRQAAPRPLAILELIEEGLKHRAASASRKE